MVAAEDGDPVEKTQGNAGESDTDGDRGDQRQAGKSIAIDRLIDLLL